jgi:hypothetical protein
LINGISLIIPCRGLKRDKKMPGILSNAWPLVTYSSKDLPGTSPAGGRSGSKKFSIESNGDVSNGYGK